MRKPSQFLLCLSVLVVLAACGQAGDLYLPDQQPAQPAATDRSAPGENGQEENAPEEDAEAQEEADEPDATTVPQATQP